MTPEAARAAVSGTPWQRLPGGDWTGVGQIDLDGGWAIRTAWLARRRMFRASVVDGLGNAFTLYGPSLDELIAEGALFAANVEADRRSAALAGAAA